MLAMLLQMTFGDSKTHIIVCNFASWKSDAIEYHRRTTSNSEEEGIFKPKACLLTTHRS